MTIDTAMEVFNSGQFKTKMKEIDAKVNNFLLPMLFDLPSNMVTENWRKVLNWGLVYPTPTSVLHVTISLKNVFAVAISIEPWVGGREATAFSSIGLIEKPLSKKLIFQKKLKPATHWWSRLGLKPNDNAHLNLKTDA